MSEPFSFEEILERDHVLVYTCKGFSMWLLLHQNEDLLMLRKPDRELRKNDIVLFKASTKYLLHRIVKVHGDTIITAGDHNAFKDRAISKDRVIGILTSFVRNGKERNVDELPIKLYGYIAADLIDVKIAARDVKHQIRKIVKRNKG